MQTRKPLSDTDWAVLAVVAAGSNGHPDSDALLLAARGSWHRLDSLLLNLERRWLITRSGSRIRPLAVAVRMVRARK